MAYTKPIFRQSDVRRAFDAAQASPVPVRSVDFTRPDGTKVSFVLDNGTKAETGTDPMTTITEAELKDLI